MFDIRNQISSALMVLGMTPYKFCKLINQQTAEQIPLSNFTQFLHGKNTLGVEKLQLILNFITELTENLKQWLIRIVFEDGSRANVRLFAVDKDTAFRNASTVLNQPELAKFVGEGHEILKFDVEEIEDEATKEENYALQKSSTDKGWWVCTDLRRQIVCKFKAKDFANTLKSTILFDNGMVCDAEFQAAQKEMKNFLLAHHKELL